MRSFLKHTGLPLLISLLGGSIAHFAGLPAGMLMGGAVAVAVVATAGLNVVVPPRLRDLFLLSIGLTLGSNVSSDTLSLLPQWPWTLVGMLLALMLSVATTTFLFIRLLKLDPGSAYLSSIPGHLSLVLALAESGHGKPSQIAVIQSTRILLLTFFSPIITLIATHGAMSFSAADLASRPSTDLATLGLLTLACVAGAFVFKVLRLPAPFVLGSMLVAMIGKLAGFYEGSVPMNLSLAGYVGMGVLIGSRFSGVSFIDLRRHALAGVLSTCVAVFFVTVLVAVLVHLVDMPFGQIWLGLAPGGIESMGAIGLALGFDTAFIAAHHATRMFLLTFAISGVGLLVKRRDDDADAKALTGKAK